MKRIISFVLIVMLVLVFAGCGKNADTLKRFNLMVERLNKKINN